SRSSTPSSPPRTRAAASASSSPARSSPSTAATSRRRRARGAGRRSPSTSRCVRGWSLPTRPKARRPALLPPRTARAAPAVVAPRDDAQVWVLAGADPGAVLPGALDARLSAVVLAVPPLAARAAELPALAAAVVEGLGRRLGVGPPRLATEALERLTAHAWPGDLADLEAVLARALLLAGGGGREGG